MRTKNQPIHESGSELLRRMAVRRRRDAILMTALAILATLGGGHTILELFDHEPPPAIVEPADITTGQAQLVAAFAQQFVIAYLNTSNTGQRGKIDDYVSLDQQGVMPAAVLQVTDPLVVYSARTATTPQLDIWTVTVSVRVNRNINVANDSRLYLRVGVSAAQGGLRALALPAVVNPPAIGRDLELAYSTTCSAGTPLADVVAGFLTAFLTGSADITRYISVDAGIEAVKPAPFQTVETPRISSSDTSCGAQSTTARVLATVVPKTNGTETAPPLAYPLTLRNGSGQWQIVSVDPVPALASPLTVIAGQLSGHSNDTTTAAPSSTAHIPPAKKN